MRRNSVACVASGVLLLAASCGGQSASNQTVPVAAGAPVTVEPELKPGDMASGTVEIDGVEIDYVAVTPAGFESGDTTPVLLVLPPGSQDLQLTIRFMAGTYLTEAVARGWVVVSPAAPDGVRYFDGSESLLPGFMEWVATWVQPEGGGFHLTGASNGGLSAFRIAGLEPQRFRSLIVFPGFPYTDADADRLGRLAELPIRMYVGGDDVQWIDPMADAEMRLSELGADVVLEVFEGEGHTIDSLGDGVRLFDELDAVRRGLPGG